MEQRSPPEFILEAFADPTCVRDVVRGILHTIFFLRYFPSLLPETRDVLGVELPHVPEPEIVTLIEQRAAALVRQLEAERSAGQQQQHQQQLQHHQRVNSLQEQQVLARGGGGAGAAFLPPAGGGGGSSGRGQITVRFFEKSRRRKAWYNVRGGGDDEVCWESWVVKVTVAEPRTETERAKVRRASESTLRNTIMKAATLANTQKDHIPPITTTESNPFPYRIDMGNSGASSAVGSPGGGAGAAGGPSGAGDGAQPPRQGSSHQAGSTVGGWAARMGIY